MKKKLKILCALFLLSFFCIIYVCNFISEPSRGEIARTTAIAAALVNIFSAIYISLLKRSVLKNDTKILCIIAYCLMFVGYALIIFYDISPSNIGVYGHAVYSLIFDIASIAAPLCSLMIISDK